MRQFTISALETASGLEVRTICHQFEASHGPMPVSSHTYARTIPHHEVGDTVEDIVETLAAELFNVAYQHRTC